MEDPKIFRRGGLQIRERHRFICDMLAWTGEVRAADLREQFAISPQQASIDLRDFGKETAGVVFDERRRCWVRGEGFDAASAGDLDEFLSRYPKMRQRLGFEELVLPWQSAPTPIMQTLMASRLSRRPVRIEYQSVSSSVPSERVICPHAFVVDHFVMRFRAYCYKSNEFRDFRVSRIRSAVLIPDHPWADGNEDQDWHEFTGVKIAPHPELTPSQAIMAMDDIGLPSIGGTMRIRKALLLYLLAGLNLLDAVKAGHGKPDKVLLYVCENAGDLVPLLPKRS